MAYPGFEPGHPRSEVRRANHFSIGAPSMHVSSIFTYSVHVVHSGEWTSQYPSVSL
jgi:hypothetical protein